MNKRTFMEKYIVSVYVVKPMLTLFTDLSLLVLISVFSHHSFSLSVSSFTVYTSIFLLQTPYICHAICHVDARWASVAWSQWEPCFILWSLRWYSCSNILTDLYTGPLVHRQGPVYMLLGCTAKKKTQKNFMCVLFFSRDWRMFYFEKLLDCLLAFACHTCHCDSEMKTCDIMRHVIGDNKIRYFIYNDIKTVIVILFTTMFVLFIFNSLFYK